MNMKLINIFFICLFLNSCSNNEKITTDLVVNPLTADKNADPVLMPSIALNQDFFDFGEINQNESVSTEFKLQNIGDAPLVIRSVKGSCGCTVLDWPKEPVEIGDEAIINVTFNSENKQGRQNKTVTLITNAIPSSKVLTITGTVLVPINN